jgi:hypothetical protein
MNDSFRIEFQSARASIERHGPQLPFRLPWEKGVWKRIFNPHSSPLSSISRSLPLPSSFSLPSSSSSSLISHPNFNSNSFQPHSFEISRGEKSTFHDITAQSTAVPSVEFWSKFSIVQIFNKDVLMDYAILLFPGLFQCLLPLLILLCF